MEQIQPELDEKIEAYIVFYESKNKDTNESKSEDTRCFKKIAWKTY